MTPDEMIEALYDASRHLSLGERAAIAEKIRAGQEWDDATQDLSDFIDSVNSGEVLDPTGERRLLRELRVGDAWRKYRAATKGEE